MEAADIFAVNKADKDGALYMESSLEQMLQMKNYLPDDWKPSVILTEAVHNKGIETLAEAILHHQDFLIKNGELEQRRGQRARLELMALIENFARNEIINIVNKDGYLDRLVNDLVQKKISPYSATLEIIERFTNQSKKDK